METALRYELVTNITELANSVYPTNAPEGATKPYLVYARINTDEIKTLDGYTGKGALSYMFSCMATKYADMKSLTNKVETLLKSMPKTKIGEINQIYIEDLKINNVSETYESALGVNRGIIDFTIHY
jgi:hypothetical protein